MQNQSFPSHAGGTSLHQAQDSPRGGLLLEGYVTVHCVTCWLARWQAVLILRLSQSMYVPMCVGTFLRSFAAASFCRCTVWQVVTYWLVTYWAGVVDGCHANVSTLV